MGHYLPPGWFIGVITMMNVRSRKMKTRRGNTIQNIRLSGDVHGPGIKRWARRNPGALYLVTGALAIAKIKMP